MKKLNTLYKKSFFNLLWIIPLYLYLGVLILYTPITTLEVTFSINEKTAIKAPRLYIDTGNNFNESEATNGVIYKEDDYFLTRFELKSYSNIKRIRFDPPENIDKIKIKSIKINHVVIDLDMIFKNQNLKIHDMNLSQKNTSYYFNIFGSDPYVYLVTNPLKLQNIPLLTVITVVLFMLLLTALTYLLITKIDFIFRIKKIFYFSDYYKHAKKIFFTIVVYLILSIILLKTFVTLLSIFYYKYTSLSWVDIIYSYTIDVLIAVSLGTFGFLILFFIYKIKEKKNFFLFLIKLLLYILLYILVILFFLLSLFYLLSGYIYLQWGAFLEPQHLQALSYHSAWNEILSFIFTIKTFIFIFIILLLFYLSYVFFESIFKRYLSIKKFTLFLFVFVLLFILLKPIHHEGPSIGSPIIMISKNINKDELGIKNTIYNKIDITNFNPLENNRTIPKKYRKYFGIAKDMNLIIYIMESTRKKNLSLYGYNRETMPFLQKMSKNALVFHNATVNQPRSMKTMGSLMFGVYPYPTTSGITWKYHDLKKMYKNNFINDNNLLGVLSKLDYKFYFGIMQENFGGEGFETFMRAIGNKNITLEDPKILYKNNLNRRDLLDERVLTDSFLKWTATRKNKFSAILWSKSAHMPYESQINKFKDNTELDHYDNCIVNIDNALKSLVEGLKKQNKLDNTLILILGDHGEAINEPMDFGHGNSLYEYSIKIPCIIYNKKLNYTNLYQRFQPKDLVATLFYMMGIDKNINQSINIFSKRLQDKIYMSNVYQDFKLGVIYDHFKFVYRPKYNLNYLYDLKVDPTENDNIINQLSSTEIEKLKQETLQWYKYQIHYIDYNIFKSL